MKERYNYAWVCLGEPLDDIPQMPHASMEGFRQVHQFDELWKIGAFRLMEYSFDPAHVAYVHRNTFGDVKRPEIKVPQVEQHGYGLRTLPPENDTGRPTGVRGELAQRATGNAGATETRRLDGGSHWFMPFRRGACRPVAGGCAWDR